jgi:hypothetical protein
MAANPCRSCFEVAGPPPQARPKMAGKVRAVLVFRPGWL